jgi:RNA polymerase sigma-70 factor (ECF subfamily)
MDEIAGLIEPQIPALRRYAWALVRDNDAADDLVQDCLEHAVGRWHLRRRDGNLRAWLFAILHNLFVSSLRQRARHGPHVSLDETAAVPLTDGEQDGRLAVRDVLTGLQFLPTEQREVLLLIGVEEMSYAEAAKILSIPVGTVMSRLSRGRESLHRFVETGQAVTLRRVK